MDDTKTLVRRLLAQWAAEGVRSLPPSDPRDLLRLEATHHVELGAELRTYFAATGGLPEHEVDARMVSWWSAGRVVPVATYFPTLQGADGYFAVADLLFACTLFCVQLRTDGGGPYGRVIETDGTTQWVRAASWSEFLRQRIEEPDGFRPIT